MNNVPTKNVKGPRKRIMLSVVMYIMNAVRTEENHEVFRKEARHKLLQMLESELPHSTCTYILGLPIRLKTPQTEKRFYSTTPSLMTCNLQDICDWVDVWWVNR